MNLDHVKQRMTVKLTLLTFITILTATIVRPLLSEHHQAFTYIGIFNSTLTGALYFYLAYAERRNWHSYLFLCTLFIVVLPVTFVSGGINSQFTPIFPLICILMCLIANTRVAWSVTLITIACLMVMYYTQGLFPNLLPDPANETKTIARLFWLVMACLLATSFGMQFERINSNLGHHIQEQAMKDGLTGLSSRRSVLEFIDDTLEEVRVEQRWLTVIMVDLDNFKAINESFGHLAGDQCLRKVAGCLKHHIRTREDHVGRYGGEEFIIVLMDVDQSTAMKISEKIRLAIEELSLPFEGDDISLTATLGYCSLQGENIHSKEQLLQAADEALNTAQKSGQNRVVGAEQSIMTTVAIA